MSTARDNKIYENLVKRFPLRPIRDDDQNELAAQICDMLLDKGDTLSLAERDYLEVLTDLITKYESRWDDEYAVMSPRDLVKFLMEQNELAQKDLVPEFGSASRVSEFLKGERRLSVEQAKRLAQRFCLSVDALLVDMPNDSKNVRTFSDDANRAKEHYVDCTFNLQTLFGSTRPITYKNLFYTCANLAHEKADKYVAEFLRSPIDEDASYSVIYCKTFNAINHWLIASRSTKNSSGGLLVSENADFERYMAFVRPDYLAWERNVRKGSANKRWLRKNRLSTYADFLKAIYPIGELSLNANPKFWNRSIEPGDGQAGFERFVIDLYEELLPFIRENR